MIKQNVKCIYYAYPSSIIAEECGFAKSGCWYLFVGDEDTQGSTLGNIVYSSPDKAAVMERSYDYCCPWGNYSLVEE